MPKRKKSQLTLANVVRLAQKLKPPTNAFNGDLRECADEEADLIYEHAYL